MFSFCVLVFSLKKKKKKGTYNNGSGSVDLHAYLNPIQEKKRKTPDI